MNFSAISVNSAVNSLGAAGVDFSGEGSAVEGDGAGFVVGGFDG
jgi:hypothetical protein